MLCLFNISSLHVIICTLYYKMPFKNIWLTMASVSVVRASGWAMEDCGFNSPVKSACGR